MYTFNSRVRYSEVGEDKVLTVRSLINYLQDCSTFQSEDVGLGLVKLREEGVAWMTASWQIVPERMPRLGEKITIGTMPIDATAALARRQFFIDDEEGNRIVKANSYWTLVNVHTGRPMRITEPYLTPYGTDEPFEMPACSRKLVLPLADVPMRLFPPFPVSEELLDTNHHVNNGQYIRMALQACAQVSSKENLEDIKDLPTCRENIQIRAEYRQQAHLGFVIHPVVYNLSDTKGCTVYLNDEEGQPYSIVELKRITF